ncbi:hypothetical protein A0H81_05420 [Grifola frondosa]|uniref:Uncharacterized protein n=1 Tax=Grifola frondosa TaxID=5627 RepID=A0A1C7ME69_GRIFR|nr:hypothetical protein A0H81_05420 [Grifola frondosa]
MEHMLGDLGSKIKQHINLYANLSQQILIHLKDYPTIHVVF